MTLSKDNGYELFHKEAKDPKYKDEIFNIIKDIYRYIVNPYKMEIFKGQYDVQKLLQVKKDLMDIILINTLLYRNISTLKRYLYKTKSKSYSVYKDAYGYLYLYDNPSGTGVCDEMHPGHLRPFEYPQGSHFPQSYQRDNTFHLNDSSIKYHKFPKYEDVSTHLKEDGYVTIDVKNYVVWVNPRPCLQSYYYQNHGKSFLINYEHLIKCYNFIKLIDTFEYINEQVKGVLDVTNIILKY